MGSGPRKSSAGMTEVVDVISRKPFRSATLVIPGSTQSFRGGEAEPGTQEHDGTVHPYRPVQVRALARARPGSAQGRSPKRRPQPPPGDDSPVSIERRKAERADDDPPPAEDREAAPRDEVEQVAHHHEAHDERRDETEADQQRIVRGKL